MVPKDFYYFVISGFIVLLIPIALVAWFQAGFFLKWLKARSGRGKFILIKIRGKVRDHFATGIINGDFLIFGKKEEKRRVTLEKSCIYTCWGVQVVDLDESSNNLSNVNYQAVPGNDAEKTESLYVRSLMRPSLEQATDKMLLILLILVLVAVIAVGFLVWNVSQQVAGIGGGAVTSIL